MQQGTNPLNELLKRYVAGSCSPEEEKVVKEWYDSLGKDLDDLNLPEEEAQQLEQKLWQGIRSRSVGDTDGKKTWKPDKRWFLYLPGAAAVLLGIIFFPLPQKEVNAPAEHITSTEVLVHEKTNNTGKTVLVVLQDESMVWLKPSASIRYTNFSMSPERKVLLKGEAFFEVSRDPQKPFLVYSGNVVTRVVGTRFKVKASEQAKTVEVEVTEGAVEVYRGGEEAMECRQADLRLTASQKAVYHSGSRKIEKLSGIVSRLEKIGQVSEEITFEFSDAPFRKVIGLLEEAYKVSIDLENPSLGECPLTASLNDETLDMKLELICRSIGASYRRTPGKIMISGEGCTE